MDNMSAHLQTDGHDIADKAELSILYKRNEVLETPFIIFKRKEQISVRVKTHFTLRFYHT